MLVFGFHAVLARLRRAPESVTELYVDANRTDPRMRELLRLAESNQLRAHQVDGHRIERMAPGKRHQGVLAIVEASLPALTLDELLARTPGILTLMLLDGVTDPRNLGACLRAADGAGVAAVIAPKDHACALTDTAVQTASGAAESVPYIMVTNLARTIDTLQENGIEVVGAAEEAEQGLHDIDVPDRVAWVLGAEGKGLRRLTRERCDRLIKIPMRGQVDSLNVAVAAGVVLYESLRQQSARVRARTGPSS